MYTPEGVLLHIKRFQEVKRVERQPLDYLFIVEATVYHETDELGIIFSTYKPADWLYPFKVLWYPEHNIFSPEWVKAKPKSIGNDENYPSKSSPLR